MVLTNVGCCDKIPYIVVVKKALIFNSLKQVHSNFRWNRGWDRTDYDGTILKQNEGAKSKVRKEIKHNIS